MDTSKHYSPHDLLPGPEPRTSSPPDGEFYNQVAKHLIKDTVRVMANGLPIDLDRVEELEKTLDTTLGKVHASLGSNPHIKKYLVSRNKKLVDTYIAERKSHLKSEADFLKPFKHSDMHHRSYFMHLYAASRNIAEPTELLATGIPKWPANTVKKLSATTPFLKKLLDKSLSVTHSVVMSAMQLLAQHKAELYNRKYLEQIANPEVELPPFNPNSPIQKRELFNMLGLKSDKTSKDTGEESWDRDQVERLNKETTDPVTKELTQALIDHSFGAIIKNNFVPAFYKYTIDGKLYGNLKLFGAKTFRYTSQNP